MEIDEYEPGVPSWIDIGTSDVQGAADFYGALFGWDAPEGPPETGGYPGGVGGDRARGGGGAPPEPRPPPWAAFMGGAPRPGPGREGAAPGGRGGGAPAGGVRAGRGG